jgi:RNA polymerase sigma factor (sigma-70 family)
MASNNMNEKELLEGCIAGNERAWKHFIRSYDRCIYGAILSLLGKFSIHEPEVAADIFASVIEKLLKNDCAALRKFKWNSRLSTWLVSVARNKTYDYLRSLKRRPNISLDAPLDQDSRLEDVLSDGLDLDHDIEVRLTVGEALDMLPDKDKLILKLYYIEGMKEKEIGELAGLSLDAVSARKSRALRKLRGLVSRER